VGRNVGEAGELKVGFRQFAARLALPDCHHVARTALVTGDVDHPAVHGHMTMVDQLSGAGDGGAKTKAETHIVEASFQQLEEVCAGGPFHGTGLLHVADELPFRNTVIEPKLLLLFETDGVFGALATGLAVLTWWVRPLGGLTGETGKVSQAPRHPQSSTAVSRHGVRKESGWNDRPEDSAGVPGRRP
jgi:hypothetical protein